MRRFPQKIPTYRSFYSIYETDMDRRSKTYVYILLFIVLTVDDDTFFKLGNKNGIVIITIIFKKAFFVQMIY